MTNDLRHRNQSRNFYFFANFLTNKSLKLFIKSIMDPRIVLSFISFPFLVALGGFQEKIRTPFIYNAHGVIYILPINKNDILLTNIFLLKR
jgi:hypothetical protein